MAPDVQLDVQLATTASCQVEALALERLNLELLKVPSLERDERRRALPGLLRERRRGLRVRGVAPPESERSLRKLAGALGAGVVVALFCLFAGGERGLGGQRGLHLYFIRF